MIKKNFALVFLLFAVYCAPKMELPPEPRAGSPPESTYTFVFEIPTSPFGRVLDIEYGQDGYLYVLDSLSVHKLFGNGQETKSWLTQGKTLDFGSSNKLVVANDTILVIYDTDGSPVDTFNIGLSGHVEGVALGESEEIYLSHPDTIPSQDFVLRVRDTVMDTVLTHGDGILFVDYPRGLEFRDGILYVAVYKHNWVEGIYVENGLNNVLHLGGLTQDGGQDTGLFKSPTDVAVDEDGYVFVADSGNSRVQVFRPDGSFLTMILFENETPIRLTVSSTGKYLFILTSNGKVLKYNRVEKPPPPPGG